MNLTFSCSYPRFGYQRKSFTTLQNMLHNLSFKTLSFQFLPELFTSAQILVHNVYQSTACLPLYGYTKYLNPADQSWRIIIQLEAETCPWDSNTQVPIVQTCSSLADLSSRMKDPPDIFFSNEENIILCNAAQTFYLP